MTDTLPQRPTFSNGQYIGADDLNAEVAYARDKTERLALSAVSWGIGTGLALVEIVDATGATQMYIEPGVAWDGYGRTIVVISPATVTADLFAGLPSGNQKVWLKYSTLETQMIAPGFQTCGAGDPATRIAETYAIVTTSPIVVQQNDGVVLNGVAVPDPRNMLIAFDAAAAVVLDGSAPHQLFPDDSAEWLVPVGIVSYNSATGTFNARTPAQLALNRVTRRYAGAVVESVLAADGVLRLRDRQTDQQSGQSNDNLDLAAAIQATDVQADPNNPTRLIGNELVWVEGAMRVLGDARLWGGALSLRAKDGTEPAGSLFIRRNVDATNPATIQNMEVSIGQPPSGTAVNRLIVAASNPATATTPATLVTPPALSVGTDARVGIGVAVPGAGLALDVKGDLGHDGDPTTLHLNGSAIAGQSDGSLLLTAASGMIELGADGALIHVAIGTKSPQADTALDIHGGGIAVNNSNAFLRLLGSAIIDQSDGILRIRSGGGTVAFDGADNVGINTQSPAHRLDVNGDANVATTLSAGALVTTTATVGGNAGIGGNLNVGGGITLASPGAAFMQLLGSRISDNNDGILHIESGGNVVAFDGFDSVGIGTTAPTALLHVAGSATVNGALTVWGVFSNPSDARLKKDIRPLEGALGRLLALRGVEFEWKREDLARLRPGRHAGLIADEVEKVFPGWVHDDPGTGMKLLGAQGFEALAVEALRELAGRIEALEQENRRLAQLLAQLSGERGAEPKPPAATASEKGRAKGKPRQSRSDRAPSPGKPSRG
jgi:Chaperone of endosialidase